MKINSRLKKIGDLVDSNSVCMDIGCDHALLDIYLIVEKKHKKVVASDIAEGPLKSAAENIKKYNVSENIELRLGNGLSPYTNDINTIIISGMGGRSMIGIFKSREEIIKFVDTIILSPNNYQEDVRRYFTKLGFYIENEELVKNGKIIYQIIKFKKGKKKYTNNEFFFGPILLQKRKPLFDEYYERELTQRKIIMKLMPKKFFYKRWTIKREINNIQRVLENKK